MKIFMGAGELGGHLLKSSTFIFALSIALGLLLPGPAKLSEPLITPALMLMMAFSLTGVDLGVGGAFRDDARGALLAAALNYGLLSGLIMVLAFTLQDEALRYGFVVMAAVPPAIAVLPLTRLLNGDVRLSFYAEAICYLVSLVLMPAMIIAFTSRNGIRLSYLVEMALLLVLLPSLASQYLRRLPVDAVIPINIGFFLVNYTVIGLNHASLFGDIGAVASIALLRTFGIGAAVYIIAMLAGVSGPRRISYTLLGSFKNLGLAAAVSLVLFGPGAGVPAAVSIFAETAFYILLVATDRARLI